MPVDASRTCPRCGSELELAGAIGHAELRRCVKPGCQWVALVVDEGDKSRRNFGAPKGQSAHLPPSRAPERERGTDRAEAETQNARPSSFVAGGVPQ